MIIVLEVIRGVGKGLTWTFDRRDVSLVGRSKRCHLCVGDDLDCSRVQLILDVDPPHCRLHDLGSSHGTFVNGERVKDRDLIHGDIIRAGGTEIAVRIENVPEHPEFSATIETTIVDIEGSSSGGGIFCARCELPMDFPDGAELSSEPTFTNLCQSCIKEMKGRGESIPGYRIERLIGEGGMGRVSVAVHYRTNNRVAVKTMIPGFSVGRRRELLFLRECIISLSLRHPNIVEFMTAGQYAGQLYIVMEYVQGLNAEQLRKSRRGILPAPIVCSIGIQTLEALAYAHQEGTIHRDIKPSNILLIENSGAIVVKLSDFGLAKSFHNHGLTDITRMGEVRGTLPFLAPEQVINCRGVDHRADIFGVGATLYYMLTGQPEFDRD